MHVLSVAILVIGGIAVTARYLRRRSRSAARHTPSIARPFFREEDRDALLPSAEERSEIRRVLSENFEPGSWVMFEFGTVVYAAGVTAEELEANAKRKLQDFGAVIVGTRTADFNASRLADGAIVVASRDPDIANILIYESGQEWTDAEQTVAGMIARGRRDADTRFLSVADREISRITDE